MVEPGAVEGLEEVDGRVRTAAQPREDPEVAEAPAVEHGGLLVVLPQGHRPREGIDAADGGQRQGRQLGIVQGVGAHCQSLLVLEEPEHDLVTCAQEVGLVIGSPQPDHDVGRPAVHLGHHVEQSRPAGPEHFGPPHGDFGGGLPVPLADRAMREPRLNQCA